MFLQYAAPGCIFPIISLYLIQCLHLSALQAGAIMAMHPLAGLTALFGVTYVADRYITAERLFILCHFLSAVVMLVLATQDGFWPVLVLYFLHGLVFTSSFGLSNTIVLHHLSRAERDFGSIRMWGAVGWVVIAWGFGYLWLNGAAEGNSRLPQALVLCAIVSVALGSFTFILPKSKLTMGRQATFIPWKALRLFARKDLMFLAILMLATSVVHQFYYFGMAPFLRHGGYSEKWIMPAMSIGQTTEIIVLGTLGWCLTRISIKRAMVVALLAQALRMSLFAWGGGTVALISGIALHGICFGWFMIPASLYVDRHSSAQVRAGAQQIVVFMITAGNFLGFYIAGLVADFSTPPGAGAIRFEVFWLFPLVTSLVLAAVFARFFQDKSA
jgi:MFS family permease